MKYISKITVSLIYYLLFPYSLFAQSFISDSPEKDNAVLLAPIRKEILKKYLEDSATVTGENKKYIIKYFRGLYDCLDDMFNKNEIISSVETNAYLIRLVKEIQNNNPALQKLGTRFLFSKVYWPNASSFGEGTIVFNIGMFTKLDNEAQVVFILCHELGHLFLDHSNKGIYKYVNTAYSDEFQEELKKIKKSHFQQNKQLDELKKELVFNSRRHGREHEGEADSLGLLFMSHTSYDTKEALTTLALLDSVDKEIYDAEKGLPVYFNFKEYPFQPSWIAKPQSNFFGGISKPDEEEIKLSDSLKTHPDCKVRVKKLALSLNKINTQGDKKFIVHQQQFLQLREQFKFDIIDYCFSSNWVSRSLYYSMELFKIYPDNAYLAKMIGKCFNTFYENQKVHRLSTIVDMPSPYVDQKYNIVLKFIENIRMDDMSAISYYFMKQHQDQFKTDKDFVLELIKSKDAFNKPEEKNEWLSYYKKTF
ncbi:MAG: M48 family metalloprotease [Sphingobacteriales bacterium]|nr:M48 family metalloprotease [Sphingobacteriales bacterium]